MRFDGRCHRGFFGQVGDGNVGGARENVGEDGAAVEPVPAPAVPDGFADAGDDIDMPF